MTALGSGRSGASAPERSPAEVAKGSPNDRSLAAHPTRPVGRRLHHLPTLAVVVVLCVGLLAVSLDHWRKGSIVLGAAPMLAAVLRLTLPSREVGLLTVRGKGFDVVLLGALGAAIIAVAEVVPIYYHVT